MKKLLLGSFLSYAFASVNAQNVTTLYGSGTQGISVPASISAAAATFNAPYALAFDNSNRIWVLEKDGNRVRMIDRNAGQVITRAGSLSSGAGNANATGILAKFNTPRAILIDTLGMILVSDEQNNCIRAISPFQNIGTVQNVGTYAGRNNDIGGLKDTLMAYAEFNMPAGMIKDAAGNIYLADAGNNAIRKISNSGMVSTIAGDGVAGYVDGYKDSARFINPMGLLLLDANNLLVADQGNARIRNINLVTGMVSTFAGDGMNDFDDGTLLTASFMSPIGLAKDNDGNIYVSEGMPGHTIRKISGNNVTTFAGKADTEGDIDGIGTNARLSDPAYIYFSDSTLYVCDAGNHKIKRITLPASSPTSLPEFNNQSMLHAFPNPFIDYFKIEVHSANANYTVTDLSGKQVLIGTLNHGVQRINASSLAEGVYIFNLDSEEGRQIIKLVKKP
ncbi:MAG: T9SS type A sorting domain-containing protein [Bacteroidota bacterium]|jgi:hypothetical protein